MTPLAPPKWSTWLWVYQAGDRAVAAVLAVEGEGRRRGLGGDQRVDHDDPLAALDHVHVGEVEAAQLVEARRQLEEPGDAAELALPPEARVGCLGRIGIEEVVTLQLPDSAAVLTLDPGWVEGGNETAASCLEVVHLALRRGQQLRGGAVGVAVSLAQLFEQVDGALGADQRRQLERAARPVEAEPHRRVHVGR